MRVLALDTASPAPALALLVREADGGAPRIDAELLGAAAAEALPGHVAALLSRAGASLNSLDRIAVLSGPGSFTGLRAGTAFARGLARACGIPLVSASTFRAALFALAPRDADLLLSAGRGEVHRARVREGRMVEETRPVASAVARDEATRDGVAAILLDDEKASLASALARLAEANAPDSPLELLYGRPSAAEERWGAG